MSLRANATKPQRNLSSIVDLQKRNFRSELTVTIPDNDNLTLGFIENPDHFYASTSFNALSTCANSKLFQHFVNCFDQMKLMDVHYCIDLANAPQYKCDVYQMHCHREQMAYSLDDGVNWVTFNGVTDIADPNAPAHPMHVITQGTVDAIDLLYPTDGMYPQNFDPQDLPDEPVSVIQFECPLTLCAATRRGIPRGFFQPDPSIDYSTPSFNDIMAHGSAIYQSKMPGAGVHLSLDCMGSSNSERMMTFPTQMINRLYQLQPSLQSGRFAPTIMIGVKADKYTTDQLRNELTGYCNSTGAQNYVYHAIIQPEFTGAWQAFVATAQRWDNTNNQYVNVPILVKVRCTYSFNMTDGAGNLTPMTVQEFRERVKYTDLSESTVKLSIQGYHSCRFKQLRTMPADKAWIFGYLNFEWTRFIRIGREESRFSCFPTDVFNGIMADPNHAAVVRNSGHGHYRLHYLVNTGTGFDLSGFTQATNTHEGILAVLLLKVVGDRVEASLISTFNVDAIDATSYHITCLSGPSWRTDISAYMDNYPYCVILTYYDPEQDVYNRVNTGEIIDGKGVGSRVCVDDQNNPSIFAISSGNPSRTYDVGGNHYSVVTTYLYNMELVGIKPSV